MNKNHRKDENWEWRMLRNDIRYFYGLAMDQCYCKCWRLNATANIIDIMCLDPCFVRCVWRKNVLFSRERLSNNNEDSSKAEARTRMNETTWCHFLSYVSFRENVPQIRSFFIWVSTWHHAMRIGSSSKWSLLFLIFFSRRFAIRFF